MLSYRVAVLLLSSDSSPSSSNTSSLSDAESLSENTASNTRVSFSEALGNKLVSSTSSRTRDAAGVRRPLSVREANVASSRPIVWSCPWIVRAAPVKSRHREKAWPRKKVRMNVVSDSR